METAAAAAMLEAGVGRFSRAPAMAAALVAEMWAPLAVVLAAVATLPSLLRRLQGIVLRIRSRGKEVIQSHMSTYYSSGDEDDEGEGESSSDEASSSGGEEEEEGLMRRIGYLEDGGCFPWGGSVVRTWQGLPRRLSGCGLSGVGEGSRLAAAATVAGFPAVRLWGASTASGGPWWSADEGGDGAAAEEVVVGWRRDLAGAHRRTPTSETERRGAAIGGTGLGHTVGARCAWAGGDADRICLPASRWRCPPGSGMEGRLL